LFGLFCKIRDFIPCIIKVKLMFPRKLQEMGRNIWGKGNMPRKTMK
jgi:hypothetical protein